MLLTRPRLEFEEVRRLTWRGRAYCPRAAIDKIKRRYRD